MTLAGTLRERLDDQVQEPGGTAITTVPVYVLVPSRFQAAWMAAEVQPVAVIVEAEEVMQLKLAGTEVVNPVTEALMLTVPADTQLAKPVELTVAIPVFELPQVAV